MSGSVFSKTLRARRRGLLLGAGFVLPFLVANFAFGQEEMPLVEVPSVPAAAPKIRFEWVLGAGVQECPGVETIREAVAARLGYEPFSADATRSLVAQVTRHGDQLIGSLELRDEDGELVGVRTLPSGKLPSGVLGCLELSRALELAIAIAIDPSAVIRPAPPPDPGAISGSVEVRPATVIVVPNHDRRRAQEKREHEKQRVEGLVPSIPEPVEGQAEFVGPVRPPVLTDAVLAQLAARVQTPGPNFQLSVWSGLTFATGVTPAPTFGFSVAGFGLRYHFVSLMTELRVDLPQSAASSDGRGAAFASLLSGTSFLCVHSGWMFGCASGSAGVYRLGAIGLESPQLQYRPYLAAGGRAGADLPILSFLGRFGLANFWRLWRLRLYVDAAVPMPFMRWRLTHGNPPRTVLWEVPPVSVVLGAAIVLAIPP